MGEKDADFPDPAAGRLFVAEWLTRRLALVPAGGPYPMTEYLDVVNPAPLSFVAEASVP
jgi:hypothetical protein